MRIIAGSLRGRKIKTPKGLATRPVLGRVREARFAILGDVEGLRVLDLYAGAGSIGIEALSRGAQSVVFVEHGAEQCRIIRDNLASCEVDAVIIHSDVRRALKKLQNESSIFDFVFADPPYEKGLSQQTIRLVCDAGLLSDSGMMAVTARYSEELPEEAGICERSINRHYGDTQLTIYTRVMN